MGNRAVIAFTDGNTPKPSTAVYMHWNGGPESVYAILDVMRERNQFSHSAEYSTARFAALACGLLGHDDGLSCGIGLANDYRVMAGNAEDNGAYIVSLDGNVTRYTRSGRMTKAQVKAEAEAARKHKYWADDGIRNTLRKVCPVKVAEEVKS